MTLGKQITAFFLIDSMLSKGGLSIHAMLNLFGLVDATMKLSTSSYPKIFAIKRLRMETGWGLKESKEFVDDLVRREDLENTVNEQTKAALAARAASR
jgi:hypothetical protein